MEPGIEDAVAGLVVRHEITEVLYRYCRGIDRMDEELVRSCYHPGAHDEHGSYSGDVDGYIAWVWPLLAKYEMTQHYLANILVEPVPDADPPLARVESYGMSVHRGPGPDGGPPHLNLTTGFRFIDDFARIDGRWAITRRVTTTEWVRPLSEAGWWSFPDHLRTGSRDSTDPVFGPVDPWTDRASE